MSSIFHISDGAPYFCVVGSPISHSKSPEIHTAFALQCDISLRYERVEIKPGLFTEALAEFVAAGGRGMNVTVPHKEAAYLAADSRASRADVTGAANMITVDGRGSTIADNSDGAGLVRDLHGNHDFALADARVLLVGAGGAARGVIPSLLGENLDTLVIVNRTAKKARTLAGHFSHLGPIEALDYDSLLGDPYDLVVNATSLSLTGQVPPLPRTVLGPETACYDMMYTQDGDTAFLQWCRSIGAQRVCDGLGMLVEQAANAFSVWHGIEPETASVLKMLR
ncbi:MAG: shikimate dehydrogenase [Gammaproteobacteria bacterium]